MRAASDELIDLGRQRPGWNGGHLVFQGGQDAIATS